MPESPGTNRAPATRRPSVGQHHGPGPMAAIAGGGALGTLARYGMERALVADTAGFPWATLTVNVIGSFVLGFVVTLIATRWPGDRWLRPLVAVGFCGGFTTFSTFAVEIDQRVRYGHAATAAAYLAASLVFGLAAAVAGSVLAGGQPGPVAGHTGVPDPDGLNGDDRTDGPDASRGPA